jgi:hypothetical protein
MGTPCLLFQVAVEELGSNTPMGGEAQLWLALAYQVRQLGS